MSQTPPTPAELVTQTYGNQEWCETFIAASLEPFGLEPPSDTAVKLAVEAGTGKDGAVVYRPYLRMAALLGRAKNDKHLNEGEGAKLRDADKTIRDWLAEQISLDAALGLTLPPAPPTTGRAYPGSVAVRTAVDWS